MSFKNFITKMYVKEMAILQNEDNTKVRLQNVAWPSECSAELGPFTVGECQRALFYKIIGAEPSEDASLRGAYICDAGIMYEKYHTERFKSLGMFLDEQFRVEFETDTENKVMIAGRIDCIIEDNGKKKGIEIKSVSAFKAPEIFGSKGKIPLPAANNLMQAMMYKHWAKNTEAGTKSGIDEIYLMYINRSDNSSFFYKVDLDDKGYPIITAIDQFGREVYTLNMQDQKSYQELLDAPGTADPEQARLAELRISTKDIFSKFDKIYSDVKNKTLPSASYKRAYTQVDIDRDLKCGRLTKKKLSALKNKGETKVDYKCTICPYMKKCLSDSGINMITF